MRSTILACYSFALLCSVCVAADPLCRVVMLGDSITKGVRPGVTADATFAAMCQQQLRDAQILGKNEQVVNVGIGGERTDQALQRLAHDVIARRPMVVTVMYGTNDSYIDPGQSASRLSRDTYAANLETIVKQIVLSGIEPIIMTEPRWSDGAKLNGKGDHPNVALSDYMAAARDVARRNSVSLVDHFEHWTKAASDGQNLDAWTTDGCHPNPIGHRQIADLLMPTLIRLLSDDVTRVPVRVELQSVLRRDASLGSNLWFHPRAALVPNSDDAPLAVMTLQQHLGRSDHYSGMSFLTSNDLGVTWSEPRQPPELGWIHEQQDNVPGGVDVAVADVTPGWHAPSRKVLAIGAQVRYSPAGHQLEDRPRSHQTAYAVFDPQASQWSRWQQLAFPPDLPYFNFARCACAQWLVERDGSLLLPCYVGQGTHEPFATTVVRCRFDGTHIKYVEHGDLLHLDVERGLYEPSLVRWDEQYFLTLRNDLTSYVTVGNDGLHFRPVKEWRFDDGEPLGCYNTQSHWVTLNEGLFLIYTRRGANNDHVIRHRAPVFMAQVDPRRLVVLRDTEVIVVPERGATLGNSGVTYVDRATSWVTVAEGNVNAEAMKRGADGTLFLARVVAVDEN